MEAVARIVMSELGRPLDHEPAAATTWAKILTPPYLRSSVPESGLPASQGADRAAVAGGAVAAVAWDTGSGGGAGG
jgi:hypothetical protein